MDNSKKISVIIPSYNEEGMIRKTAQVIHGLLDLERIPHELLFVDDGSKDNTWKLIEEVAKKESYVTGIHFSRNFGKEAAIIAGLSQAAGACSVVIDCDLQHPPKKIVEMYRLWESGYEVIEAVKTDRGNESKLHEVAANSFYSIMTKATKIDMKSASDFKLLDKKAVLVLINMKEKDSFFRALSSWVGFKSIQIPFEVQERECGESKWSTSSLIRYAISNITSFSTAPMQIVTGFGGIMLITSIIFGGIALVQKVTGAAVAGFTTVIILQLFSSSIVMLSIGIIGYYIAKIYEQCKDRPRYIISEIVGKDNDKDID